MKITHHKFKGKNKEATVIERSMKYLLRKYGFNLVSYVTTRILTKERDKIKLMNDIASKEKELAKLKRQVS